MRMKLLSSALGEDGLAIAPQPLARPAHLSATPFDRLKTMLRKLLSTVSPGSPTTSRIGLANLKGIILRGAFAAFLVRALGIVIGYAGNVWLARWAGAEEFGLYAYAFTWMTVLAMVLPLGLNDAVLRLVPEYSSTEKWARVRGIVIASPFIVLLFGAMVAVGGILAFRLIPPLQSSIYANSMEIALLTAPMLGVLVLFEGTGRAFGSVVTAFTPRTLALPLFVLLAAFLLMRLAPPLSAGEILWATFFGALIVLLIQAVMIGISAPKQVRDAGTEMLLRSWLRISLPLFVVVACNLFLSYTDVIVIGALLQPDDVAVYHAASRTALLLWGAQMAVGVLAAPLIALLNAEGRRGEMAPMLESVIHWGFWPCAFGAVVLIAFAHHVMSLFGANFVAGTDVLIILVITQLACATAGPVQYMLTMTGRQDRCALIYAICCAGNLALCVVLVRMIGIEGAAVAKLIAFCLLTAWMVVEARRHTGLTSLIFCNRARHRAKNPVA